MNHTELTAKTTITDIEIKQDKNQNPYFKLSLRGFPNCFYAFADNLSAETLTILKETPEKLINQLALIAYEELQHKDKNGTFYRVKGIEIVP